MNREYKRYLEEDQHFDRQTLMGIFALLIVIAGCFGWYYEFIFYFFNGGGKEFYWRGGNFLPWINIYATGSIMIYFLTYKRRKNPLKVFLISFFSCGILEYFSGLGMYLLRDGLRCWDYNNEILNFGNIGGFVCLRSATFFALSGLFLIYVIIPFIFYLAKNTNKKAFLTISFIFCGIILFDEFYNLIFARVLGLPRATAIYRKLGFPFVVFK
ncbi:MAG: putative ABC transporter permease [Clostridium sp.]|nr:putative ABC transporter permease [Clostridium sp.]